ncbi:MAG: DUF4139 domain-containing protein [bacterium]
MRTSREAILGRSVRLAGLLAWVLTALALGVAQAADERAVALTIYSSAEPGAVPPELYRPLPETPGYPGAYSGQQVPGFALVRDERAFAVEGAKPTVRFTDVAARIDPTTVSFTSLGDPGTRVLEQSYQFDLVSSQKLLERYIDREITVDQQRGDAVASTTGTLLSTVGGLVLKGADGGIQVLNGYANLRFPELPGGLITRPTLVWLLSTEKPGAQRARVTYETDGIAWWADYNLVFAEGENANAGKLDVGAWVSILNQSGAGYDDARLKLMAGDVHRAPRPQGRVYAGKAMRAELAMADESQGFTEKEFFEYHLYTLGRRTTLPDRSTKQIELFPVARGVPCEKLLVYYGLGEQWRGFFPNPMTDRGFGSDANTKVDVYLRFKNAKETGLGIPFPRGRIRVSKLDTADQSLELVGEDTIDHTAKDEKVLVKMGTAFDVVGERKQVDFRIDNDHDWMDEDIEIKLRNHKSEPVQVVVKENLFRWVNWQITQKTHDFEKVDARTVHFPVTVPKDGEAVIRYTVHYSW